MNVGSRSVTANIFFAGFTSPVDIDEDEKEFITAAAEQLGCKLSDSFFELGNLNKDTLTCSIIKLTFRFVTSLCLKSRGLCLDLD